MVPPTLTRDVLLDILDAKLTYERTPVIYPPTVPAPDVAEILNASHDHVKRLACSGGCGRVFEVTTAYLQIHCVECLMTRGALVPDNLSFQAFVIPQGN